MSALRLPVVRGDCQAGGWNAARPCRFACRWNNEDGGCALDVADAGGATFDEIGEHMGISRSRVYQIEQTALGKLARVLRWYGLTMDDITGAGAHHALDFAGVGDACR